jgi:hypothetical protein
VPFSDIADAASWIWHTGGKNHVLLCWDRDASVLTLLVPDAELEPAEPSFSIEYRLRYQVQSERVVTSQSWMSDREDNEEAIAAFRGGVERGIERSKIADREGIRAGFGVLGEFRSQPA